MKRGRKQEDVVDVKRSIIGRLFPLDFLNDYGCDAGYFFYTLDDFVFSVIEPNFHISNYTQPRILHASATFEIAIMYAASLARIFLRFASSQTL